MLRRSAEACGSMTESTKARSGSMCGQGTGKMAKMGVMTALCCVLPMVAVMAVFGLSMMGLLRPDGLFAGGASLLLVLLCPLLMGGVMVAMLLSAKKGEGGDRQCH